MDQQDTKQYTIQFDFNEEKSIEALLYVLSQRPSIGLYNLMKIMFEADKVHLNNYGRPVTGDVYIAMKYGTVPSHIYDIVKHIKNGHSDIEASNNILCAKRQPNLDLLSETDKEVLDSGVRKYADLDFQAVYDMNHKELCWTQTGYNKEIDYSKIIENKEVLDNLIECGRSGLKLIV